MTRFVITGTFEAEDLAEAIWFLAQHFATLHAETTSGYGERIMDIAVHPEQDGG